MGLDVTRAYLGKDNFSTGDYESMKNACLARVGLGPHYDTPGSFEDFFWTVRAYPLNDLGRAARRENWDAPHIKRITCSCYQMIVPVDFPEPIRTFENCGPEDFRFYREKVSDKPLEYLLQEERSWSEYAYKLPYDAVYMLSSHALVRETQTMLDQFFPQWEFTQEFFDDFVDTEYPDLLEDRKHLVFCLLYTLGLCHDSVRYNQSICFL